VPELPEVEYATRIARAALAGADITRVRTLHPSLRRHLPDADAASLQGERVETVERRGKHQLLRLTSGRTLHVHFRMTGDWRVEEATGEPGRFARVVFELDNGTRLVLRDSRALAVVALHPAGVDPLPDLGPEATADAFTGTRLAVQLARRSAAIKPALLDQHVVAGIGNIYASEALWYARVKPTHRANRLSAARYAAVAAGVKRAMTRALAHPERYYGADGIADAVRFNVYDREGRSCRRCRTPIRRIVQAGRSTYYCPKCQR
jgi:formamidopyrimidine-DNA glycosylase